VRDRTCRVGLAHRAGAVALIGFLSAASLAYAVDQPLDAVRLKVKRSTSRSLVFVSHDPRFLFPVVGGSDDPAFAGATIDVVSASEGMYTLVVPSGSGTPGWTLKDGTRPRIQFKNGHAPFGISFARLVVLKSAKTLKVVLKSHGLALAAPQGSIGIRITTGALRSCALFDAPTIRKDQAGVFSAKDATATTLADCSDFALFGGVPACGISPYPTCGGTCAGDGVCATAAGNTCRCVFPSSPCGDTSPVCNGTCGAGEECAAFALGSPTCGCIPAGTQPCGTPGYPVCGGSCPGGAVCRAIAVHSIPFGDSEECTCANPGPCAHGGYDCGNGFVCNPGPPYYGCIPARCDGSPTYPTCGGSCASGAVCQPLNAPGGNTICLCAVPEPCDASCGGYTCAAGEVCHLDDGPVCGCGAP